MELKICIDEQDRRTCKARLNSKLWLENNLMIKDWILIETNADLNICKAFPIYSSFHSMENIFVDKSISIKKQETTNNTPHLKIKKLNNPKKSLKIVLKDQIKDNGEGVEDEEDQYSKLELMGLIISVGFTIFQRWQVLEIDDQTQMECTDKLDFYLITKETEIHIIREFKEEKKENEEELTKQVGGLDKIIEEIEQVALFPIIYSEKFKTLSPEFPKGMLIIGNNQKPFFYFKF